VLGLRFRVRVRVRVRVGLVFRVRVTGELVVRVWLGFTSCVQITTVYIVG
jgi:hypothetical protein